jgi:uncharacterized OsmC-like protein
MSSLRDYLIVKRDAVLRRWYRARAERDTEFPLLATVTVEGRSGIRRIRIRDFQVLSDSLPDYAGFDLGPASPELQLGTLGSCIAHTTLICAAAKEISLDSLEVRVTAVGDLRAGTPDFPDFPVEPQQIGYVLKISSTAPEKLLGELRDEVDAKCPVLALLRRPQVVRGNLETR